jgi:hypothetical protein
MSAVVKARLLLMLNLSTNLCNISTLLYQLYNDVLVSLCFFFVVQVLSNRVVPLLGHLDSYQCKLTT